MALLALGAGLLLGTGIGLPTAHWVAGFLVHPAAATTSAAGGQPSPPAQSRPSSTPAAPSSGTPSPSPTPTAPPPTCPPLASGQQPLDALRPPPSGYAAASGLDWLGCGDATIPATAPFTVGAPWLVVASYSCPAGTAAQSTGSTLTVSESGGVAGAAAEALVASRGDAADVIGEGAGGSPLGTGSYRLSVVTASACLWHLAVYRG
jgi:hypothetical protein